MVQEDAGGGWCWEWEENVQYADLDTNDHVNNVVFLRAFFISLSEYEK